MNLEETLEIYDGTLEEYAEEHNKSPFDYEIFPIMVEGNSQDEAEENFYAESLKKECHTIIYAVNPESWKKRYSHESFYEEGKFYAEGIAIRLREKL